MGLQAGCAVEKGEDPQRELNPPALDVLIKRFMKTEKIVRCGETNTCLGRCRLGGNDGAPPVPHARSADCDGPVTI